MSHQNIKILSIEASGAAASVALYDAAVKTADMPVMITRADRHGHAAWITEMVDDLMQQEKTDFHAITHIAAGAGPGSFTGIRVGLAAAQGYGIALAKPVLGIPSLDALGFSVFQTVHADLPSSQNKQVLALIDTRRGHYFGQCFDVNTAFDQHSGDQAVKDTVLDMDADMLVDHMFRHHAATACDALYIKGFGATEITGKLNAAGVPVMGYDDGDVDAGMIGRYAYAAINSGKCVTDYPPTPRYHSAPILGPAKVGPAKSVR
ncbi:tRNA (adenosine(37)-N6)-threonylcarbamoyltransferase complex dimerization subunit type 1 TsaB [Alphaproteobacteria bacterium]|nr:tRNA (adenosine(37)-N6)-threonylcarbamoyltransferase complex dimerization subunit type 1 TsaB [Alphaproteobacteria bacterium]